MAKKYRMLVSVEGTFHGLGGGVKRGDIVELDDASAKRYLAAGYIETNLKGPVGQPYKPSERQFEAGFGGRYTQLGWTP
jgi:hypothetical protein